MSAREKESYDKLKARTQLVLDGIIEGVNNEDEIEAMDTALFSAYTPNNFTGSGSVEISYDKGFESSCLIITQKTGADARRMTVLQFYNALDMVKRQAEAESKSLNLHKHGRR